MVSDEELWEVAEHQCRRKQKLCESRGASTLHVGILKALNNPCRSGEQPTDRDQLQRTSEDPQRSRKLQWARRSQGGVEEALTSAR